MTGNNSTRSKRKRLNSTCQRQTTTGKRDVPTDNRWQYSWTFSRHYWLSGNICSVAKEDNQMVKIIAHAEKPPNKPVPRNFQKVLVRWKHMWMWENLSWVGEDDWVKDAIRDNLCIAVTDGSYMKHLFPSMHSAALVLECSKGQGRLWCSFTEQSNLACSNRGELVGLMAIHLLLLAINE